MNFWENVAELEMHQLILNVYQNILCYLYFSTAFIINANTQVLFGFIVKQVAVTVVAVSPWAPWWQTVTDQLSA